VTISFGDILAPLTGMLGMSLPVLGWQDATIGELNKNLFCTIRSTDPISAEFLVGVRGLITSYSDSFGNNYDSRMEDTNIDNRLSTIAASLQSGEAAETAAVLGSLGGNVGGQAGGLISQAGSAAQNFLSQFQGKTMVTQKSTMVIWTGAQPFSCNITLSFQANTSTYLEVDGAYMALARMATPELKESMPKAAKEALDEYQKSKNAGAALKSLLGEIPPNISISILGKHFMGEFKIDNISREVGDGDKMLIDNTGGNITTSVSLTVTSTKVLNRSQIK